MSEKVARNLFSLTISKLLASVIVFIGYASIFRYLGTVRSGQYQFILAFATLYGVIVDFGLQQYVIKKVSEFPEESEKYFGNFFTTEIILALFVYVCMIVTAIFGGYNQIIFEGILTAGFGVVLCALSIPFTAVLSGHQEMRKIAYMNFSNSMINVGIMAITILTHRSVLFLVTVQIWMGVINFLFYSRAIRRYIPNLNLLRYIRNFNFKISKDMLMAALPFGMLIGFSIIYNKIDVIILSSMRGYAETGIYTAAYKFVDALSFFPGVVSSSLYPFFSSALRLGDMTAVKQALTNYTRYMIIIALPLAFGGMVLAPKLMLLVGGSQFVYGYKALEILVFANAVMFIYAAVNSLIINQMTKVAAVITFVNIFVNTIGNLILIPRYGFQAAAVMTLVSELVQAICYFIFIRKKIVSFPVFRSFPKPIVCAAIMALVLWPLRMHSLAITLPLGAIVYATLAILTGMVKPADLDYLKRIFIKKGDVTVEEQMPLNID